MHRLSQEDAQRIFAEMLQYFSRYVGRYDIDITNEDAVWIVSEDPRTGKPYLTTYLGQATDARLEFLAAAHRFSRAYQAHKKKDA